ncbi:MAG: DUF3102 domain-containing protein, partial [Methyloceanibacter sp.]
HTALKRETADILTIGTLLVEAKAQVKHGEWLPWLKQEFSMSERSAQNYMKAAQFVDKNEIVADLKLSPSALYLLSGDSYWADEYGRRDATDAVLKVASEERVGYDRAKEIIDETRAKKKARDEAIAEAMADDKERAKHDAAENSERWDDLERDWTEKWIANNWGDEQEAEFEAEWKDEWARKNGSAEQAGEVAPELQAGSRIETTSAAVEQPQSPRSAVTRKDETRPRGAGAADRDARRVEGIDQIKLYIREIKKIVSSPFYDDRDRLMIRREHRPFLDGFISEKGKCCFDAKEFDSAITPTARMGNDVSPDHSAQAMKAKHAANDDEKAAA